MNFNETLEMIEKSQKTQGSVLTKLLVTHLLSVLEYKSLFEINALTQHVYQMIQYTKNLILLFVNIDQTLEIREKNTGKLMGIPTKELTS